jgi:hypothetical protein
VHNTQQEAVLTHVRYEDKRQKQEIPQASF